MSKSSRPPRRSAPPPEYQFGGEMARSVRIAYRLAPLIELLEEHGHAVEPLLSATEIPPIALEEPSYRISLAQELAFTRRALARLKLSQAGLLLGRRCQLPMFGVVGLAAACAPSMRRMLHTILSFPALAWGLLEISVWRDPAREFIAFEPGPLVGDLAPFFVERDIAATLALFRGFLGSQVVPVSVSFSHFPPDSAGRYDSYFGCRVAFAAAVNEICFEAAVWDAVPPQANAMSHRFFSSQCRQLSAALAGSFDYTDVVRAHLRTATPMPSLPALARALPLTVRTLQRRLAAEGTDFSELRQEIRMQRARELLQRGHLPIDAIAYRLGFIDPAAFSRAFKQWTGQAPSDFRRS